MGEVDPFGFSALNFGFAGKGDTPNVASPVSPIDVEGDYLPLVEDNLASILESSGLGPNACVADVLALGDDVVDVCD